MNPNIKTGLKSDHNQSLADKGDRRGMTSGFSEIENSQIPVTVTLTQARPPDEYIPLDKVPGKGPSSVAKMTQPSAEGNDNTLSPYVMSMCNTYALLQEVNSQVSEQVNMTAQRRMDALGIDYTVKRNTDSTVVSPNETDYKNVRDFYARSPDQSLVKLTLNEKPFLEQPPTKPYFKGQKIIIPDISGIRDSKIYSEILQRGYGSRDDSNLKRSPVHANLVLEHNREVLAHENDMRAANNGEALRNKANYFVEMVDYLKTKEVGDCIAQSSFETSSDKNMPHLQFLPQVNLPVFNQTVEGLQSQASTDMEVFNVKWELSTLAIDINLNSTQLIQTVQGIQTACRKIQEEDQVSTTPVFLKTKDNKIRLYLILKKDLSAKWNMTPENVTNVPGWLESCGVFIGGTAKAKAFQTEANNYYGVYAAPEDVVEKIKNQLISG